VKQGLILEKEAEKMTYLNELDVRKRLVVSIAQRSEELRLCQIPPRERGIFKYISWLNG
jgi:hypothetical protein